MIEASFCSFKPSLVMWHLYNLNSKSVKWREATAAHNLHISKHSTFISVQNAELIIDVKWAERRRGHENINDILSH